MTDKECIFCKIAGGERRGEESIGVKAEYHSCIERVKKRQINEKKVVKKRQINDKVSFN